MRTFQDDHDDDGETFYPPYFGLPPETVQAGYRIRPEATWSAARDAYLAGETAESVCARFDLALGTFRQRAKDGGWRRVDQPAPPPGDEPPFDETAGYAELAEQAFARLRRAVAHGRAPEAAAWMRLHDRLRALAAAETARPEPQPRPQPRPAPKPDPIDAITALANSVGDLARQAYAIDPNDAAAVAALEAGIAALDASRSGLAPMADSDDSDSASSIPESETRRADLLRTRERRLDLGLPVGDLDAALATLDRGP